jgi:hypothetical protein
MGKTEYYDQVWNVLDKLSIILFNFWRCCSLNADNRKAQLTRGSGSKLQKFLKLLWLIQFYHPF